MTRNFADAYAMACEAKRRRKMRRGGRVALNHQDDDLLGPAPETYNTSGEPHTDGLDEMTHPMEFMADGGIVEDDDDDFDVAFPGESTRDVTPSDNSARFFQVLKRRPRRFAP